MRPLAAFILLTAPATAADPFDRLTRPDLVKAVEAGTLKPVTELTAAAITQAAGAVPKQAAALAAVQTQDGRWAKLLVVAARQKVRGEVRPALLVERYATFRDGEDRQTVAAGRDLLVFPGVHLSLDLGQVVPADFAGDVAVSRDDAGAVVVRPVGAAKLFLADKPVAAADAPKTDGPRPGDPFEPRFAAGTFQLFDDGRRSGKLTLAVDEVSGEVSGEFYSDKDGRRYDVAGKLANPKYLIQFRVKFPRAEQHYHGYLFTGDYRAIAGTSRLNEREAGFYAVRAAD